MSNQGKRLAKRGGRRVRRTEYRKEARIYVPRNTVTGELSHEKVKKNTDNYIYFVRVAV